MPVDDYLGTCPDCGGDTFAIEDVYRALDQFIGAQVLDGDVPALVQTCAHGVLHTAAYKLCRAIGMSGEMYEWAPEMAATMHMASVGAAGAIWSLLATWPRDPFKCEDMDAETAVRTCQSQVLCAVNLHEWATPPPGDLP